MNLLVRKGNVFLRQASSGIGELMHWFVCDWQNCKSHVAQCLPTKVEQQVAATVVVVLAAVDLFSCDFLVLVWRIGILHWHLFKMCETAEWQTAIHTHTFLTKCTSSIGVRKKSTLELGSARVHYKMTVRYNSRTLSWRQHCQEMSGCVDGYVLAGC